MNEGQQPFDCPRSLRVEIARAVPEAPLDYPLPTGAVKEGCIDAFLNETIPLRDRSVSKLSDPKLSRTHRRNLLIAHSQKHPVHPPPIEISQETP